ncbi:MAG: DinB family protein [Tepidisphaeraceae bacterium]|jgi:hypothetical protein
MNTVELGIDGLKRNQEFLAMTLADFSDADMLARPCPGANHAAWQLGHLIVAETGMVNGVKPGAMPELPAGFADKFSKETCSKDDAAFFPTKAQLLDLWAKTRAGVIAWAKTLNQADLDRPAPEKMQRFVPTVGHLLVMMPVHATMHIGQFQVIRRKLGKPILF